MPFDVLAPQGVLDQTLVLAPDIQQRQLGFAAELLAGEEVREDGGTIDQMMLQVL